MFDDSNFSVATDDEEYKDLINIDVLMSSLGDIYDLRELIEKLKDGVDEICHRLRIKHLYCNIVMPTNDIISNETGIEFTIFEQEGPEYDAVMRQHATPSGETIQCSVSFLDFIPSEQQLVKGKLLCEIVSFCVGRARVGTNLVDSFKKDVITGMPNTKAFFEFGNKLFYDYSIANYCVIALNVSNFKYVNQTVPFNVGTVVLVRYAHKLLSFVQADEFVTRAGGDNFNILIKKEHVEEFLEKVKTIPVDIKDGNMRVHFELSCYAGICVIETRMSVQVALERASNAMTVARKDRHTPFMYYTDSIGEMQHHANKIRAQFQRAIDDHEFVVYYQPKVNLKNQKIIGMEALIRWDLEGKIVGPGSFVPILEEGRYIIELDRYVLRSVCRDIKRWESMEIDVPRISVNLSRKNLQNPNIAEEIAEVLNEYHVDFDKVEIEVTETDDSAGFDILLEFIAKMKKQGIKVSIDDFGTGYSSLNVLKNMNADVLKIDRSFINLEKFTDSDELLVKSIVSLANAYNMEVITEGVETEEQIKFLTKVGCENVQGYFFDKPLSKEVVTERIKIGNYDKKYKLK